MTLETHLGKSVVAFLTGHSSNNGALIPGGSSVVVTSNDPTVATVENFVVPDEGAMSIQAPVTLLSEGSTDFHAVVTTPDGDTFESTATLLIQPTVLGLVRVELELAEVQVNPLR